MGGETSARERAAWRKEDLRECNCVSVLGEFPGFTDTRDTPDPPPPANPLKPREPVISRMYKRGVVGGGDHPNNGSFHE